MQITVNSSSYAVKFYESLGFSKTSEEQETDGLNIPRCTLSTKNGRPYHWIIHEIAVFINSRL